MADKGTMDNPFDTLQEAFDACEKDGGKGKVFWVYNPNAKLEFYEIDEEEPEEANNE